MQYRGFFRFLDFLLWAFCFPVFFYSLKSEQSAVEKLSYKNLFLRKKLFWQLNKFHWTVTRPRNVPTDYVLFVHRVMIPMKKTSNKSAICSSLIHSSMRCNIYQFQLVNNIPLYEWPLFVSKVAIKEIFNIQSSLLIPGTSNSRIS